MKKKRVILHEGQMDVIASYRSNLKEAICTLGTALSDAHAKTLSKYTRSVVICYDGDKAGINASKKAIRVFKSNGFTVHLVLLPDGMDPDEYVLKYGKEAYYDYFENNQIDANQYLFEVAVLNKDFSDSNIVMDVKNEVFAIIQSMNQATEQEDYLTRFSKVLNTSLEALRADYDAFRGNHAIPTSVDMYPNEPIYPDEPYYGPSENVVTPVKPVKKQWNSICELRLFMYARSSKEKAMLINSRINDTLGAFSVDMQNLWIRLVDSYYYEFDQFDEGKFVKMLSDDEMNTYLQMIEQLRGDSTEYSDEDMYRCIEKLKEVMCSINHRMLQEKMARMDDIPAKTLIIEEMIKNKLRKQNLKNSNK